MEAMRDLSSIEINNNALVLVQSGRVHEAMELLQLGLSNLRDRFRGEGTECTFRSNEQAQYEPPPTHTLDIKPASLSKMPVVNVWSIPIRQPHESSGTDGGSFLALYDRALCIDPRTSENLDDDTTVSAVILYNMGLLHHARGLDSGLMEFYERARRLYHIALDVLDRHNDSNDLLRLALYNNVAHIEASLVHLDDMKESLAQLSHILARDSPVHSGYHLLDEDDLMIFCWNAIYGTNEREFSVAPAA